MLVNKLSAADKRSNLRKQLAAGKLLRFPGSFSPIVSILIEELGFDGVYISGAVLAADLGLPDIGLTTQTEVAGRGKQIASTTNLPSLIDIDTGFGEPMNVARTVRELESVGLSGCHLEDQLNPKRCGHLDHKQLIDRASMAQKVRAACDGRSDPNFIIMARTDARAEEGLSGAIDRAKAYVDAGADMIFPEALQSPEEFEKFRKAVAVPLLANMTEFGKSPLLNVSQLSAIGFNIVIYPVSTLRLALKSVEDGLRTLIAEGTQELLVDKMQTRARLYELLRYESYNSFDQNIFNFTLSHNNSK